MKFLLDLQIEINVDVKDDTLLENAIRKEINMRYSQMKNIACERAIEGVDSYVRKLQNSLLKNEIRELENKIHYLNSQLGYSK